MVVMTPHPDEAIAKLIRLANGDVDLVRRAINEAAMKNGGKASVTAVIAYINGHRGNSERAA